MIFSRECYTCIVNQAISAAHATHVDEATEDQMIRAALVTLLERTPTMDIPEIHALLWPELFTLSSTPDPYAEVKLTSTRQALGWMPELRAGIEAAADPFNTALRVAIAGNVIDTAVGIPGDVWSQVKAVLEQPFAIDDSEKLRTAIEGAENILYLCDNAGETVFDRLLIETIDKKITYVVKGGPILNDSMIDDATLVGLDQVATVIDNGNDGLGTQLDRAGDIFLEAWKNADLIIAKGMGNFETLYRIDDPRLFFLMKLKCAPNARMIGVPQGSIVVAQSRDFGAEG